MRVPLDMTDSKRKRKYIEKICLYNCFTHCIDPYEKKKKSKCLWKGYVYTIVLHIVFDIYGKESKANVYGNDMFIQLFFFTLYLNRKKKNAK